ncbi:MAG: RHS repeat-associated core domain-containing protein [Planctomycetota bacterium]
MERSPRSTLRGYPPLEASASSLAYDDQCEFDGPQGRLGAGDRWAAGATGSLYAPLREQQPFRYEFLAEGSPTPSYLQGRLSAGPKGGMWIEHDPSGVRRYFGAAPESAATPPRRAQVRNELGTFSWLLVLEEDPHGNTITYEYHDIAEQDRTDPSKPQKQPIIARISWGGNREQNRPAVFVAQTKVSHLATGPLSMMSGDTLLDGRIDQIAIGPADSGADPHWTYDLDYVTSEDTGRLLLSRITRRAPHETDDVTTFSYGRNTSFSWGPAQDLPSNLAGVYTQKTALADFNLDASTPELAMSPPDLRSATHFLDFDGDGLADIIYHPAGLGTTASFILDAFSFIRRPNGTWQRVQDTLEQFGIPGRTYISELADVDGDFDTDALTFYSEAAVGSPSRGRPADFIVNESLCSDDNFWNRCGFVDPMPPGWDRSLKQAGYTRVDLRNPEGPIVVAGILPGSPKKRPMLVLVHPPKELRTQAAKLPPLFADRSGGHPALGPRADGRVPSGEDIGPGKGEEPIDLDVRAGAVRWGGDSPTPGPDPGPGGGGRQPGGIEPFPVDCIHQVEACIDLQAGFGGELVGGVDPAMQPDVMLGPIEGYSVHDADLGPSCRGVSVIDMPLLVLSNQSIPAFQAVAQQQVLKDWPRFAVQREIIDKINNRQLVEQFKVQVISDFLAPVSDLNGDGRADIALLKSTNRVIGAPPEFRFVPRVYLGTGDHYELDLREGEHTSRFTSSLVEILDGGVFEECRQPADIGRPYPLIVNYNAMLVDVNADGLPDLVVARAPEKPSRKGGQRLQPNGHLVFLNRGYRFDHVDVPGSTFETFPREGRPDAGRLPRASRHPFEILRNRELAILPVDLLNPDIESGSTLPSCTMALVDINADGRVDCVFVFKSATGERVSRVFLNTGRGFAETTRYQFPQIFALAVEPDEGFDNPHSRTLSDMGRFVDLDDDGLQDLIIPGLVQGGPGHLVSAAAALASQRGVVPDLLVKMESSAGSWTAIDYVASTSAAGRAIVTSDVLPGGHMVVQRVRSSAGPEPAAVAQGAHNFAVQTMTLAFRNYVRDMATSESIGFEEVKAQFQNALPPGIAAEADGTPPSVISEKRIFDVRPTLDGITVRHPLRSLLRETVVESGTDRVHTRQDQAVTPLGESAARIRPLGALTGTCLLGPGSAEACRWTQTQVLDFDALGNPTTELRGFSDGTSVTDDQHRVRVERTFENRTQPFWIVGLKSEEKLIGYREDVQGQSDPAALLSDHTWVHDEKGLLLEQHRLRITPAEDASRLQVPEDEVLTYRYNTFGLPTLMQNNAQEPDSLQMTLEYQDPFLYPSRREVDVTQFREGRPRSRVPLAELYRTDLRTGRVEKLTDFQGKIWKNAWDSKGRILKQQSPGGPLEAHAYHDHYPRKIRSQIRTGGQAKFRRVQYVDAEGHELAVLESADDGPTIRRTWRVFDAFGREVKTYRPAFVTGLDDRTPGTQEPRTVTTFDGMDRTLAVRFPDGRVIRHSYEPFLEIETDAKGNITRRELDCRGGLIALTRQDSSGQTVAHYDYVRDGEGHIVRIVDADGSVHRLERDRGGRIVRADLPHAPTSGGAIFEMRYDLNDELVEMRTPMGRLVTIARDEVGRAVQYVASGADGPVVHLLEYDAPESLAMGRLARMRDASGVHVYGYDELGHRTSIAYAPAPELRLPALAPRYVLESRIGPADHLFQLTLKAVNGHDEETVLGRYGCSRDGLGRLTSVTDETGASGSAVGTSVKLDAEDRLSEITFANGIVSSFTYDAPSDRLQQISYRQGTADITRLDYQYDPNGNPEHEVVSLAGQASRDKQYGYDALDRLSSATISAAGASQSATYGYSPAGNLLSAAGESYVYDDPRFAQAVTRFLSTEVETRTIAYNDDGRVITDQHTPAGANVQFRREIRYDSMGIAQQMAARRTESGTVTADAALTFFTDHTGRRIVRRTSDRLAQTVEHVIAIEDVAEILPERGIVRFELRAQGVAFLEDARSLQNGTRVPDRSFYLHTDLRGSVVALSPFASGGQIAQAADYEPWGDLVAFGSLTAPEHAFLGADRDPVSGCYQLGPRLYDPSLRRFLSPDPFLWSRPELEAGQGLQLNLYSYAANNPLRRTDPSGLQAADEPSSDPDGGTKAAKKQTAAQRYIETAKKFSLKEIGEGVKNMVGEKVGDWGSRAAGRETRREQTREQGAGQFEYYARDDQRTLNKDMGDGIAGAAKAAKETWSFLSFFRAVVGGEEAVRKALVKKVPAIAGETYKKVKEEVQKKDEDKKP